MPRISFGLRSGTFQALHAQEEPAEAILGRAFYEYVIEEEAKCLPAAVSGLIPEPVFVQDDFESIIVTRGSQIGLASQRYSIEMSQSLFERIDTLQAVKGVTLTRLMNNALDSHMAKTHIEASFD